jgi:hypothetical protein
MHTVATWLELAAHARSVADDMSDPTERTEMLDIVSNYERQARETVSYWEITRYFGAYPLWIW